MASTAVLVGGWEVGVQRDASLAAVSTVAPSAATSSPSSPAATTGSPAAAPSATPSATATAAPTAGASTAIAGTFTGTTIQTRYGDVQVAVTFSKGRITDVTTPILSGDDGRSNQINSQAAPMLRQEVLAAQSANVSTIGGATFTSEGYITSLQAALDKAHGG